MGEIEKLILSEAGVVALLLFLALLYMAWRERQCSAKLEKANDKILDISLKTLDTLNKLTDAIKESGRRL